MARYSSIPIASFFLTLHCAAFAVQVPAGTPIELRLQTRISTQASKPKDAFEAVVIAPVVIGGEFLIPAGAAVRGAVEKAGASTKSDERSTLALTFTEVEVGGARLKLAARLSEVDNARESVDDKGEIAGILASETISGRLDAALNKLGEKASGFAGVLAAVKGVVLNAPEIGIAYEPGTEFTIQLTAPLELKAAGGPGALAKLIPIQDEDALARMVGSQPFQTWAERPSKPSDITNVMLAGTQEQIERAFKDAGWYSAAALNELAKLETFRAIAEQRGYEVPVSVLLLEKRPPDLVFEKLTNTFAQRHHLRVWRRPDSLAGKPVWLVAATHDTGIDFSEQARTFIHKIDSQIDRERAKVVNDLLFTGHVQSVALVDRPEVPRQGQNATGDNVETDGRMAVLVLN